MQIIFLLLISIVLGWVTKRLGFATVVGQLLAGVIIGPALLGLVHESHLLHLLSEAGVWLLMYNAGLETDVGELRQNFRAANAVAVMGVLVPLITFPMAALWLGYGLTHAIFWGIVFAATSISITIAVLSEQNKLGSKVGTVILGAAVLDDIMALILVTVFSLFVGGGSLGITSLMPIIIFGLGLLSRQFVFSGQVLHYTELIGNWSVFPLFFGSIGLAVTFDGIEKTWPIIIVMSLLAVASKFMGAGLGAKLVKLNRHESRAIGAGMISRGEMALIIAQIGVGAHILSAGVFSEFVLVIMIATIVAPLLMRPLFAKI